MNKNIQIRPIGIIRTPYRTINKVPHQGAFFKEISGWVKLDIEYRDGLIDLDGFSHAILIYYFHKSKKEFIIEKPFLENKKHGIFSIRSPHRPNHIGISTVKIEKIIDNKMFFAEAYMLGGTPLIDIKPYISFFDHRDQVVSGWLEDHYKN